MMKRNPDQIVKRYEQLKAERGVWETHWQEILDYTLPNMTDIVNQKTPGTKKGVYLFDNTAMTSCEMLASALHGMLTNPNTFWFELATRIAEINELDDVREYLQELTETSHRVLNSSNFQTEIHQFYLDLITIGTAIMTEEPNQDTIVHFHTKHIATSVIAENSLGKVDELTYCEKWEANQVVETFGKELLGTSDFDAVLKSDENLVKEKFGDLLVAAYKDQSTDKFEVLHTIYKSDLLKQKGMQYVSQYILRSGKDNKEMREGGFKKFPYLVARWIKASGEKYGRSPSMTALPEAKTVNQMMKAVIKAAQKVVDPPTQGPDDGFLRPLKTAPGSHHYYRAGTPDRIEAIFKDINPRIGFELIRDRQEQIKKAFYVDKLNLATGDRATTVEVNQRIEEQLRFLSPMLGRQRFEVLIPLIDRLIDIMVEHDGGTGDLLGEPPAEIQDIELSVQYTSPIARAQIVTQGHSMVRALEASAQFIQLDQSAVDVIDATEAVRINWRNYGAPQKALRSKRELEDIRAAREQAQAQALQQQQDMMGAEMVNKVAPVLK